MRLFFWFVLPAALLAVLSVLGRAFATFMAALLTFLFGFCTASGLGAFFIGLFGPHESRGKETGKSQNR